MVLLRHHLILILETLKIQLFIIVVVKYIYTRPCGWMRFALNVNKYNTETDGKTWLGHCNGPNEWLVSYHGTNDISCSSIAKEGYQLSKCTRFAYGKGIYSTPSIDIAKAYGKTFMDWDSYLLWSFF
ncbi:hypothetical protein DDB_G0286017 [Dictyostelium discoideum AX4]|uniref:PARP catalytic domain-containing protein n=1 Tax=Dictyostelium discoideum TaxID=44689 RepID=Q54ME5_DICDI|nr:hypothetical protein DDB_G0286017 [Dictyostelium discoideum AX4]EAL64387.1 hypothetical protein DDB_G0286017 [Dictyostelium discoideum AX4]|eukprot:XP_637889.1 hypothetical protein DDB_G0286017 [Dictyostelium discoideum AX4]